MQGSGRPGLVDLLIKSDPPNHCYTVIEFKNIQIDYFVLEGDSNTDKAELVTMYLTQILKLLINSKFHPDTMEEWLEGDVHQQFAQMLQAHGAGRRRRQEIIGSRHILIREMDREANGLVVGNSLGNWTVRS